jgi:hypothetical protein
MATIVRIWKGYGTAVGVKRYCDEHFTPTVLPQLRAIDGFVSATVLVRDSEVVVATTWQSLDAIKRFAGADYEAAVVEPVVRDILDRFESRVSHYSVALTA